MVKNPPAKALDKRDAGSIPRWERSPGGGHGNPLQFSCLENTMDRGAWWATVHWVAQSQTQLKWLSSSSSINTIITFSVWKVLLFDPFVSYSYNPSSFCSISNYLLLEKVVYTHVQFINTHRLFKPLWFLPVSTLTTLLTQLLPTLSKTFLLPKSKKMFKFLWVDYPATLNL